LLKDDFMKQKVITIEHPVARLTLAPRRPVPHSVCRKTIRSIEGVLNAALLLSEEAVDDELEAKLVSCVDDGHDD